MQPMSGIAVDQLLVAEGVHQIDAVVLAGPLEGRAAHGGVVDAQVVVLAERPGRAVGLAAALALGEADLRREAAHRAHAVVVRDLRVDDHQRAVGLAVVRRGEATNFGEPGIARTSSSMSGRRLARGEVAVQRARVAAVERGDPRHVRDAAVAVHVIPARPDDAAVVGHAGMPLVAVVEAQAVDVAAVGGHVVERVERAGPAAAQVAAAPLADEGDPAVGQPARVEIVPRAVGQLLAGRCRPR